MMKLLAVMTIAPGFFLVFAHGQRLIDTALLGSPRKLPVCPKRVINFLARMNSLHRILSAAV